MTLFNLHFCYGIKFCIKDRLEEEYQEAKATFNNSDDRHNFMEEFQFYNGNHQNSIYLLDEDEGYHINETKKNWDKIIDILDDEGMLENVEPKDMKGEFIFRKVVYLICGEVINEFEEE